jgi:hypothetical protein
MLFNNNKCKAPQLVIFIDAKAKKKEKMQKQVNR